MAHLLENTKKQFQISDFFIRKRNWGEYFAFDFAFALWFPKKINGKSCHFFKTFPKYENWRLGTTFCSQITFSVVGRGLKLSNMPQFHKGGPCREQQGGKMTNQNRCLVLHVACNFLVIFLLKHLSLGEIWGWGENIG